MANSDRLTGLDSSFLHLERGSAHMHVGSCVVFEGEPPVYEDLLEHVERRLHLVPRYRQKLAFVPLDQGRPVWVDDPSFNLSYHVRPTGLPRPGDDAKLRQLSSRLFSQALDRSKPLWELWLVTGLSGDRFAMVSKTHHCLVDGVSGVDIATVLFDTTAEPPPMAEPPPWTPRPTPAPAQLLAEALIERTVSPAEIVRGLRAFTRVPRQMLGAARDSLSAIGSLAFAGNAPETPLNQSIGPHRRFEWTDADLKHFKVIKQDLGGTVNDVVLTAVSLALGRFLRRARDFDTTGVELKAMVPVSVRADADRGALGNQVATMFAPLPVGIEDPRECFNRMHEAMGDLKESSQAVGAQVLTELTGFAPPTIMAQAARLQARQRFYNLVVTNVPGPQFPLYVLGRKLTAMYPQVPLAENQGVGIAIMSYDGGLYFGLLGDFDVMPDLADLATDLGEAIHELAVAAGAEGADTDKGRPPLGIAMPRSRGKASTRKTAPRSAR